MKVFHERFRPGKSVNIYKIVYKLWTTAQTQGIYKKKNLHEHLWNNTKDILPIRNSSIKPGTSGLAQSYAIISNNYREERQS